MKAKSAARSDGGQGVTAVITARRSNVRKKKEKVEEAICVLCCVECNAIDLHGIGFYLYDTCLTMHHHID